MASNPTYEESKQVAEDSRDAEYKQPSFGRGLFLGDFDLDLIHPQPEPDEARDAEGEAYLKTAAHVPHRARRSARDRGDGEDPRGRHPGAQGHRRARHQDPEGVRRSRPDPGLLQPLPGARRRLARGAVDHALGPPVDRPARAAEELRLRGAEAGVAAEGRQGPHLGLPAHRARRRLGPGASVHERRPDRRRLGLHHQRHQAVGDQRRHRRRRRRHGRRPEDRRAQGRHHRLHLPDGHGRRRGRATATSSWACAASRTR